MNVLGKRRVICLNCLIGNRELAWQERDFFSFIKSPVCFR